MADSTSFSKRIFAMLLEKGKGDRSWRQFSIDCDISYVQMRKLAQENQENPPRPKLIKKIADGSYGVLLEDYMFAIGVQPGDSRRIGAIPAENDAVNPKANAAKKSASAAGTLESYKALTLKQRRMVDEFCEFLKSRNEENK